MPTTLTIDVTAFIGTPMPNSVVRIDLNNCSDPRVIGTGQIVPKTLYVHPVNGIVTVTLFSTTEITCGPINVIPLCAFNSAHRVSYYSFNFIYQGEITSIGSYRLLPGTYNLSDLTPCYGRGCISDEPAGIPINSEVPAGAIDGTNALFTTTLPVDPGAVWLYLNGVYQTIGVDFNLSGNQITFLFPPPAGSIIYVVYVIGG